MYGFLILIIPFSLIVISLALKTKDQDWRYLWMESFVYFGTLAVLIVEVLSYFSQIQHSSLVFAWLVCDIPITIWLVKIYLIDKKKILTIGKLPAYQPAQYFCLFYILFIILITGLIALEAPPGTGDALSYHLSRVMNWMQNQNVAHYPTNILRQLDQPPGSSFLLLHLYSLWGSDLWAGMLQWFSMIGSVIGVSLIARELGVSLNGQILAGFICASFPLGILQAPTSQNDYVVTFWLVCFAYGVLLLLSSPNNLRILIFCGLSLGLAYLTKATAYIYSLPFLITLSISLALRYSKGQKVKALPILITLASCVFILNVGHWSRNYLLFGSMTGVSGNIVRSELLSFKSVISSLIRGSAIHLAVPFQPINHFLGYIITWFHKVILNLDPSDPRTTFNAGHLSFHVAYWETVKGSEATPYLHEDSATNCVHFILILIATSVYILDKKIRSTLRSSYLFSLFGGFIIVSSVIKWTTSFTRFQMPFFVLFYAFIGVIFSVSFQRKKLVINLLIALLALNSLPYVFFSQARPLIPSTIFDTADSILTMSREQMRWEMRWTAYFAKDYKKAVKAIKPFSCNTIGLDMNVSDSEYIIWAAFKQVSKPMKKNLTFQSVAVTNVSQQQNIHPSRQKTPCVILVLNRQKLKFQLGSKKKHLQTYVLQDKIQNRLLRYEPVYRSPLIGAYVISN